MAEEIEMKVFPSYIEEKCIIIFTFQFFLEKINIGEVILQTCNEAKIAYCSKLSIKEEYRLISMNKMMKFLNIIGIQDYTENKQEFLPLTTVWTRDIMGTDFNSIQAV